MIGESIGRYQILEQIGEGGMATVYRAFDTRLERDVAVKFIRHDRFASETVNKQEFLRRFRDEVHVLAKLSHPGILKVLDSGEHHGQPYIVAEFHKGGTQKDELAVRNGQPLDWQIAVRRLSLVARALEYAHDQGFVHRDVKPANILLPTSGIPVLADFGIAKILTSDESLTITGTQVGIGTPAYMAPEQAISARVDHRADIYSLGVVLYEMVTGRQPFIADTPLAVLIKHQTDPLPRPRSIRPALPVVVERILLKALAKRPEDRYATMGQFATALEQIGHGQEAKGS